MAVDLSDYVDVLRREVTPPGGTQLATVSDDQLVGYLADAWWEAYLDAVAPGNTRPMPIQRLLLPFACDLDGVVTPRDSDSRLEFSREGVTLTVIYAGLKILRNQLINTGSRFSAKAGPVSFETENSAMLMTEMARQLQAVKDRFLTFEDDITDTLFVDAYTTRSFFAPFGSYAGYVGDTIYAALGSGSLQLVDLGGEGV